MNKFASISKKADSILDQIKAKAAEYPEAVGGVIGAGTGGLLSHLIQDPENRALGHYLMSALGLGSLGALTGYSLREEKPPVPSPEPIKRDFSERISEGTADTTEAAIPIAEGVFKGVAVLPHRFRRLLINRSVERGITPLMLKGENRNINREYRDLFGPEGPPKNPVRWGETLITDPVWQYLKYKLGLKNKHIS
jgi:hypothetical protein